MEALQQQQDRIENLKLQVERKKQVKSKLKQIKETDEKPQDQLYEKPIETKDKQEQIIEDILEHIEEKVEAKHTEAKNNLPTNEEYAKIFKREANNMRNNIPKETRMYYDEAIKKFDFTLSLDDNIKSMIDYCKNVVNDNTLIANTIRNKQIQNENKKEIVQKSVAEKVTEQAVDSKIYKLMKLK